MYSFPISLSFAASLLNLFDTFINFFIIHFIANPGSNKSASQHYMLNTDTAWQFTGLCNKLRKDKARQLPPSARQLLLVRVLAAIFTAK